jgi:hypothetical protein
VKRIKTRIAAAATIIGLGGLAGVALSAGNHGASQPVAAKPLVRTKVIRRTIHVTKHAKPKHPVVAAPPAGSSSPSGSAPVTTGSSGAAAEEPVTTSTSGAGAEEPVTTATSGAGGETPITTATSGAGGGGGEEQEVGFEGAGEREGGDD